MFRIDPEVNKKFQTVLLSPQSTDKRPSDLLLYFSQNRAPVDAISKCYLFFAQRSSMRNWNNKGHERQLFFHEISYFGKPTVHHSRGTLAPLQCGAPDIQKKVRAFTIAMIMQQYRTVHNRILHCTYKRWYQFDWLHDINFSSSFLITYVITVASQAFSVAGPQSWNNLPADMRNIIGRLETLCNKS